ncbi:MAG: 2-phosphosulfolactate phosphatase [Bacteroidales bacterium]|jgi:2-phosphosulfolactate phosphatase|nr:2-phosphosulfolactate phosphatase [Bacteroidales bacterium]
MNTIEVCLVPELYQYRKTAGNNHIAVVVDILRASTTMVVAIAQGVQKVIPVTDMNKLSELKKNGYLIISERDGIQSDFADFGNSPLQLINTDIKNAVIAISTTNGTRTLSIVNSAQKIFIGAFVNVSALCATLRSLNQNIVIVCSGWKYQFSLEDALFAGAVCENLTANNQFASNDDSVIASMELWKNAKNDLLNYVSASEHYQRLYSLGAGESVPYCFELDICPVVPILEEGTIMNYSPLL